MQSFSFFNNNERSEISRYFENTSELAPRMLYSKIRLFLSIQFHVTGSSLTAISETEHAFAAAIPSKSKNDVTRK
jgi:hypothetical protein